MSWPFYNNFLCEASQENIMYGKTLFSLTISLKGLRFRSFNFQPKGQLNLVYMEKEMAPYSGVLAWKIPWTEEPGRLPSMGLLSVGHDWATSLSLFTFIHWRRKWQPTPVFLPGESQGWGSLVGCHLWGRTESDMTEATWKSFFCHGLLLNLHLWHLLQILHFYFLTKCLSLL